MSKCAKRGNLSDAETICEQARKQPPRSSPLRLSKEEARQTACPAAEIVDHRDWGVCLDAWANNHLVEAPKRTSQVSDYMLEQFLDEVLQSDEVQSDEVQSDEVQSDEVQSDEVMPFRHGGHVQARGQGHLGRLVQPPRCRVEGPELSERQAGVWSKLRCMLCGSPSTCLVSALLAIPVRETSKAQPPVAPVDVHGAVKLVDYFKSHLARIGHQVTAGIGNADAKALAHVWGPST